jgi:hypothetical protein
MFEDIDDESDDESLGSLEGEERRGSGEEMEGVEREGGGEGEERMRSQCSGV